MHGAGSSSLTLLLVLRPDKPRDAVFLEPSCGSKEPVSFRAQAGSVLMFQMKPLGFEKAVAAYRAAELHISGVGEVEEDNASPDVFSGFVEEAFALARLRDDLDYALSGEVERQLYCLGVARIVGWHRGHYSAEGVSVEDGMDPRGSFKEGVIDVQVVMDKSNATARYTAAAFLASEDLPVRIDYR